MRDNKKSVYIKMKKQQKNNLKVFYIISYKDGRITTKIKQKCYVHVYGYEMHYNKNQDETISYYGRV